MRKRDLQDHLDAASVELQAANAELYELRVAQRRLEEERAALQSELDTERFVQRTLPTAPAHPQVVEDAPGRRIVHLQATVIDERAKDETGGGPVSADEEAWHQSIRDRLTRACRDAENLLSVAEPSPVVRAARYALAFALRDSERMAGEGPLGLEAGDRDPVGLPAGEPTASPEHGTSG